MAAEAAERGSIGAEPAAPGAVADFTWDAWAPLLRPRLPPLLVDDAAFAFLRRVGRRIPGDCLGILELRLADGSPEIDFAVRFTRSGQARAVAPRLPSAWARRFVSSWARRPADLRPVASLWLEFDSPPVPGGEPGDGLPTPVLCARLGGPADPDWLAGVLLPAMLGGPLCGAQRGALTRCLAALPPRARVLYAFSLLGRPGGGVRIELCGLEPAAMAAYLRRAVSPAAAARVASWAHLVSGADRFHLSFDLDADASGAGGDGMSPRIGVECGLRRQPRREPRWAELLDRLVAEGLASRAKREALFAWPGQDSLWTAADRWPAAAVGLGGHCGRCLSHLKLVLREGRPPEAKAYLLFQHLPGRSAVREGPCPGP